MRILFLAFFSNFMIAQTAVNFIYKKVNFICIQIFIFGQGQLASVIYSIDFENLLSMKFDSKSKMGKISVSTISWIRAKKGNL